MGYLIPQDELLKVTGYARPADLERHLMNQGIWYGKGRAGRIYTTPAAFEAIVKGQGDDETLFDSAQETP